MMALTATASNSLCNECCTILGISSAVIVQVSPDKLNIMYACQEFTDCFDVFGAKLEDGHGNGYHIL